MTIGGSLALIAVGAILKWAVTAHISGLNLQTAGTVLLIVGLVGLVVSLAYMFLWTSRRRDTEATVVREPPRYR